MGKRIHIESVNEVIIEWSQPKLYSEAILTPNKAIEAAYYYKVMLLYNKKYKLVYIGKSDNSVAKRLTAHDHKRRINQLSNDYSRHKIMISFGHIIDYGWDHKKLVTDVEKLLIYSCYESNVLINKKEINSYRIPYQYTIKNKGFLKGGMYKEIQLGVFAK